MNRLVLHYFHHQYLSYWKCLLPLVKIHGCSWARTQPLHTNTIQMCYCYNLFAECTLIVVVTLTRQSRLSNNYLVLRCKLNTLYPPPGAGHLNYSELLQIPCEIWAAVSRFIVPFFPQLLATSSVTEFVASWRVSSLIHFFQVLDWCSMFIIVVYMY